jgi:hypothetical protein
MEMPLDDYHFDPHFKDKKIKREFMALLPEGEELLWMGKMKRAGAYWYNKGTWAVILAVVSLFLSGLVLFYGYAGFVEGEFEGQYSRLTAAFGAALLPWGFSYLLAFRHLVYDAQVRYAFSATRVLLYRPVQSKQPYQWKQLDHLEELSYTSKGENVGTISYSIVVPDYESGEEGIVFLPLFEFVENGGEVFKRLVALQEACA